MLLLQREIAKMMPEDEPTEEMISWGACVLREAMRRGKLGEPGMIARDIWRIMSKFRAEIDVRRPGADINQQAATPGGEAGGSGDGEIRGDTTIASQGYS